MDIGFLGYVRIFKRSLICLDDSFNEETVLGLKKKKSEQRVLESERLCGKDGSFAESLDEERLKRKTGISKCK